MKILISILVGIGLFFILCDVFEIPFMKTSKAIKNLSKRQKKKSGSLEIWLDDLTDFIAKHIHMNEYKRIQLLSDLQSADMRTTPERHLAKALVKAGLCLLLAVPAFFIFPLITPLVVALAIAMYAKESGGVRQRIKARRSAIESELPSFVFTIEKTLSHNRDVLSMLESYRDYAGEELKHELSVTIADMRSGNYESALVRFESRVGSSMVSDVVRGLISIIRGDDTRVYWASLGVKFSDYQRQLLKQEAIKVPSKVKRLSMVLMFCFMALYLVVIGMEIVTSLGAMFG